MRLRSGKGRAFSHYGWKLEPVKAMVAHYAGESTYIGAYLNGELVGFVELLMGTKLQLWLRFFRCSSIGIKR